MNVVGRERFTPSTAVYAVNPMSLSWGGCGLSPPLLHIDAHGRTIHLMACRRSQSGERTLYRFMPTLPSAREWTWRLVVIRAGVNATYIKFPRFIQHSEKKPDLYVSDQCMDSASCRYSTTAAAVEILRQSTALPYHDRLEGILQHLPKGELKMNLSLPVI